MRQNILPTRVLWQNGPIQNADVLLQPRVAQALVSPRDFCEMKPGASLLLDFGRELNGSLCLVTGAIAPHERARVRIRLGESASEAMAQPDNDHSNHDFEIDLPTMGAGEWGLSGFRFARLDLLSQHTFQLIAAQAVSLLRPLQKIGAFECSDALLNRIWQVGADTVHLCLQEFIWDGIKRDRLVWMGDLNPEIAVVAAVWGDLEIVPQTLDFARDTTPLPSWINGMVSNSIWWLITQYEWLEQFGARFYFDSQRPYALGILERLLSLISENGDINWSEGAVWCHADGFLDWPSSRDPEAVRVGMHALLVLALQTGQKMARLWNETALETRLDAALQTLVSHAPAPRGDKTSASLRALAGLQRASEINTQILAIEPTRGVTPFFGRYILQTRADADDMTGALDLVRKFWGGMLELGATSFWEHFDLDWMQNAGRIDELPTPDRIDVHATYGKFCYQGYRHSLCHGWAGCPTAFLSRAVLGVEILEIGCKTLQITPQLGDLEWARGSFPTPFGPVHICHEKRGDDVISHIQAPPEITIVAAA